jgi:hypothetical protein
MNRRRQRQTETDRDRQRQTETDRDRQRQTEIDRGRHLPTSLKFVGNDGPPRVESLYETTEMVGF